MIQVAINILNWNRAEETLQCIDAISRKVTSGDQEVIITISVLDNGSTLRDWQKLSDGLRDHRIQLERLEVNLGFAGGHNQLLRKALGCVLN